MRYRKWFLLGMFLVDVLAPGISSVHGQTFTSFDASVSTSFIPPTSINPAGEITGCWGFHGFVRLRDGRGTITTFNVPGAFSTVPMSINPAGEITGFYGNSAVGTVHGFVRD